MRKLAFQHAALHVRLQPSNKENPGRPTSLVQAHRDAVQHLPPADQAAICSGTATRVYRLADLVETFAYVRYAFYQHAVNG